MKKRMLPFKLTLDTATAASSPRIGTLQIGDSPARPVTLTEADVVGFLSAQPGKREPFRFKRFAPVEVELVPQWRNQSLTITGTGTFSRSRRQRWYGTPWWIFEPSRGRPRDWGASALAMG